MQLSKHEIYRLILGAVDDLKHAIDHGPAAVRGDGAQERREMIGNCLHRLDEFVKEYLI